MDDLYANLALRDLLERVEDGLQRTLDVGLHDHVQRRDLLGAGLRQQVRQRSHRPVGGELGRPGPGLSLLGHVLGLPLVGQDPELVAGLRHVRPPEYLDGL